ncbi:hypothetical protein EGI22_13075 [Lacihabitans sp. LS3-19]|uniref:hypothetical protein n=1 Tax=Lacihabitans sp. LS3-19 TaxID=2487335 RepID=UPI0020CBB924|nr:hypothetical protein [Lacihabitans sp. LS3-19]MCP9768852.1 hypothetical protein [Lacihabitans sp. LS3-19]
MAFKKQFFFFITFVFLLFNKVSAQVLVLGNQPEQFIEDYSKQMQKQLGSYAKAPMESFSEFYKNTIQENSKTEVISLIQFLTKKGVKPIELLKANNILIAYQKSGNSENESIGLLAKYLRKTFEPQSTKNILEVLYQLNSFFETNQLYTSAFNRVKIVNGNYTFAFFDKKQDFFNPSIEKNIEPLKEKEDEDIGWGENLKEEEYDPWNDPNLNVSANTNLEEVIVNIPKIQGIHIVFDKADLVLLSPSDSIVIHETSGAYDFSNGVFVGQNGIIEWLAADENAKASLEKYYFKSQNGKLKAEKVLVEHENVLKTPVEGVLEIKLEKRPNNEVSSYPRFKSYHSNADLILQIPSYEYLGGYTLVGSRISSMSVSDPYTKLIANKDSRNRFVVIGRNLVITDSLITSEKVSFVTRFDKDSVSHPAVRMEYDLKRNHLQLNKLQKSGFRTSMYSDTFHQVDIRCDAMSWDLSGGKMDFYIVAGKSEVPALFESFNYYNPERVRALSTAAGFSPLIAAGNLYARKKINAFTVDEMMAITRKERFQVSNGMLLGNQMGFFDYDPYKNIYSLSRKGIHYFLSFNGKTDFDDLVLSSLASGKGGVGNASINLDSKALDIQGAQDFKLSDSLGISFVPADESMKIVGNKVFSFNGKIVVKNFKFYGDFEVEYENFLVKLKRIDSITFIPLEIYNKGGKTEIGANFQFGTTGTLYLNSPENKSGRKKLLEYPKLNIPGGVLVHFTEKGRIQKYDQGVFFKANSLNIDSLNAVNPVFAGIFTPGEIFKTINENLVVMPDSSMGIVHKAKTPYKLYQTESTIKAETNIVLDKRGLKTSGEITHLAGKLKTSEVKFYSDYLTAKGETGRIVETNTSASAYFPEVAISEYEMLWNPSQDSMIVNSDKGFNFYSGSTILKGGIVLKKAGLFGTGVLDRKDSDANSENFKFNKTGFLAENSTFNIKSGEEGGKPIFSGKKVGVDFNVINSIVNIASQTGDFNQLQSSLLEFPYSNYSTTIDKAIWNIKGKKITMQGALESSLFTSTLSTQYGLKFNGTDAVYDIANLNLRISGVNEIHSADAAIIPNKGLVAVKKDGMLEDFENAKIVADTLNRYHTLTNATVKINSKISFAGNADYQFVNVSSDTFNIKLGTFEFAELSADGTILNSKSSNKLSTIAKAKVTEKDSVYLSPKMLYKGDITMLAPFKNLSLNGQVLPEIKKYPMIGGSWINYKGNKSEAISINVDETLKDGGKPLFVGLHFKSLAPMDAMYPSFLSFKKSGDDLDIFLANGVFKRDEPNKKFVVGPEDEIVVGNRYEFYDEKGIMALEGKFNLLGAPSKIFETVGIANILMDSMKYQFSTLMSFDFPMSIPTTQKLGQNIVKANLDAGNSDPAIEPESPYFLSKLGQYVGFKEAAEYKTKSQKEHIPLFKYSNKFLKSIVLSDLNLKWNAVSNAYYSTGTIGISNIGDVDINAQTNGYLEIIKSPQTGDEVHLFFEISPSSWYYFVYKGGSFGITSSDEEINKLVSSPTASGKEKKSDTEFIDAAEAMRFRKKFLQVYLGLKESDFAKKPANKTTLPGQPKSKSPTKKEEEKEGF